MRSRAGRVAAGSAGASSLVSTFGRASTACSIVRRPRTFFRIWTLA